MSKHERELEVWRGIAELALSPSHGPEHIQRVQDYAERLCEHAGVRPDLVRIAAILHDLGRGDDTRRHGLESVQASSEYAARILTRLGLSLEDRDSILEAIESHDQPALHPPTIMGQILKDADFLAGFGAWGVLRIAMWSGETGRRMQETRERLVAGMRRRANSLELDVSRELIWPELQFSQMFSAELDRQPQLGATPLPGCYVVLEGISGSGKNTVAEALGARLLKLGISHRQIEEPGTEYKLLREGIEARNTKVGVELKKALLMADRAIQLERSILPALRAGEVVISVRSYLSTSVYQAADDSDAWLTMYGYKWMPPCDLLALLDLPEDDALARISSRNKKLGEFEKIEDLRRHRERYMQYYGYFPARSSVLVDARKSTVDVERVVASSMLPHLISKGILRE